MSGHLPVSLPRDMRSHSVGFFCGHHREIAFLFALLFLLNSLTSRAQGQAQSAPGPVPLNIDDRFVEIGNSVPAFGGLFVDEDKDTLYVYMVPGQAGDLTQVDQAINAVFGSNRPREHKVEMLPAQYTFLQLKAWRDPMSENVLSIYGVAAAGIDHGKNRLIVEVEHLESVPAVERQLATLGIPREAVNIEQTPKMQLTQTLQGYRRPDIGGLQVVYYDSAGGHFCTHWLADFNGLPGFVTCSHCSKALFKTDGTIYYQPDWPDFSVPSRIGSEANDPPLLKGGLFSVTCGILSLVPSCRWSDSNFSYFGQFPRFTIPGGFARGFIARPTGLNNPDWNGMSTFMITAKRDPVAGEIVLKVGRTTGTTIGKVSSACIDINYQPGVLLCQYRATLTTLNSNLGGDSGSPVFMFQASGSNVTLAGIDYASNYCEDTNHNYVCPATNCLDPNENSNLPYCRMAFSPISGVEKDLGTLTVCADGTC